jgi:hypothetical protein
LKTKHAAKRSEVCNHTLSNAPKVQYTGSNIYATYRDTAHNGLNQPLHPNGYTQPTEHRHELTEKWMYIGNTTYT